MMFFDLMFLAVASPAYSAASDSFAPFAEVFFINI